MILCLLTSKKSFNLLRYITINRHALSSIMKVTSTQHFKSVFNKISANKRCEISGKSSDY